MKERLIIFGASSGAVKVAQTLQNIGLNIEFFLDNDSTKHGKTLENIGVKSPKCLHEISEEYKIVIASIYHSEIEEQLIEMGIKKENIILKEKYIIEYINRHCKELMPIASTHNLLGSEKNILIDMAEGIVLGGIEKWSLTIAEELTKKNRKVTLLTTDEEPKNIVECNTKVKHFDLSFHRYLQSVKELAEEMIAQLPCVVIVNKINQVYMAAYLVKSFFGDSIKILSVLHSDYARTYEQNELVSADVDAFLCVSEDVKNKFINQYNTKCDKIYFRDSPIIIPDQIRVYSNPLEPIILGYGGRLEKAQKRADLLIPLLIKLEDMKLSYRLMIAGEGSYSQQLMEFISSHELENKVALLGAIPFDRMKDFWLQCDVVLNLSDLEGIGLSMLEAMAVGAVPIVTDTAGARSFIVPGVNGYVNACRDTDSIAHCIEALSKDREKLKEFGNISRTKIMQKCDPKDYITFLCDIFDK